MKNTIFNIFIIGFLVFIFTCFFYQIGITNGSSMKPTYKNGDILIIKKFNLDINRNDVVLAKTKKGKIIKRVIGVPNDTLFIKNGYIYINNKVNKKNKIDYEGILNKKIKLKENEFFLIGDNVNNSIDSRFKEIGIINKKYIIGKILN